MEPESCCSKQQEGRMWKRLWGMKIKGKIKHFLWRAYHRLIPTSAQLKQKGMMVEDWCKVCGEEKETMEHICFHCEKAQLIWKLSQVSREGLLDLTECFPDWWIRVCNIGQQEINQNRLELSAYVLWGI